MTFRHAICLVIYMAAHLLAVLPDLHAQSSPYSIDDTDTLTIHSERLGRSYDLYVKRPSGYSEDSSANHHYPVIYLSDAHFTWVSAVGMTRPAFSLGGYEKSILVGISYAEGEAGQPSRIRDFTPTVDESWTRETGGAEAYAQFMINEVVPHIDETYRTRTDKRIFVGQSLGGLLGSYILLKKPGIFSDFILTSPSLWWDDEMMFALEEDAFRAGVKPVGRVYYAVGETETPAINGRNHDMVGQMLRFAKRLRSRNHAGLEVRDEVITDSTHQTTFPIGFTRAMRWLMPGDNIYNG